jgi:hypothetical protein
MSTHLKVGLVAGAAFAALAGLDYLSWTQHDGRLAELESGRATERAAGAALARELESAQTEVSRLAESLAAERAAAQELRAGDAARQARLAALESELGAAERSLDDLRAEHDSAGQLLERTRGEVAGGMERLDALARDALSHSDANARALAEVRDALPRPRDLDAMWDGLVAPVVQLSGEHSVGSGVLLESTPSPDGWTTHVLSAWHVVRDILEGSDPATAPIPVTLYARDGSRRQSSAALVESDADLDLALLELADTEPIAHGARLPSPERLAALRVFQPIYAVGCPLGNDPVPAPGEISDMDHEVDGQRYWMINAPTFIGNSGGGIFLTDTRELAGIFSKIYNYGSARPTVVPHMGLVTPLDRVYTWLEASGHVALIPGRAGQPETQFASAGL